MSNNTPIIDLPAELKKAILKCPALPSLPAVVMQVIDASKDPDIGLAEVSEIIRTDPALSAKLLKIANSPLYSLRRTIYNLREALTLLGLNASLTIALSFTLVKSLQENQDDSEENDLYWRRSLLSATIARHMGFKLGLSHLEDLFLSSLLQDIGVLALKCTDERFYQSDAVKITTHEQRVNYELQKIATDHAQVGAWLLQSWHLPEKLYQAVLDSHEQNEDAHYETEEKQFQQCITLAGNIADIWLNDNHSELLLENMTHIESALKINDEEFKEFITDINNILPEISTLFDITISDSQTRERVLDEARELMLERNLQVIKQSEHDRRQLEAIEEKNKDLIDEARRDPLTGLYHRKYFEHLLEEEFENANMNRWPLSLAFIDLDNFKNVNDEHGHLVGDQVLRDIASFFSEHVRQTDVLARYGGDEFILMLPGSTNESAVNMLSRLLKNLREEYKTVVDETTVKQTVSIGLASHMDNNDFDTVADFINAADEALYKVKETSRDNIASY